MKSEFNGKIGRRLQRDAEGLPLWYQLGMYIAAAIVLLLLLVFLLKGSRDRDTQLAAFREQAISNASSSPSSSTPPSTPRDTSSSSGYEQMPLLGGTGTASVPTAAANQARGVASALTTGNTSKISLGASAALPPTHFQSAITSNSISVISIDASSVQFAVDLLSASDGQTYSFNVTVNGSASLWTISGVLPVS